MNRIKEKPDKQASKEKNKVARPLIEVLNGNFLTRQEVLQHLPFFLFLSLLALIYIANGYMAESNVRKLNKLGNELKELRSEQITTKSELNNASIESELIKIIEDHGLGLEESYSPPKKIVIDKEKMPNETE